jgi:hypothetical protein
MDTLEHAKPTYRRVDAILDKQELMSRGIQSAAVQGGVGAFWREKVKGENQTPVAGAINPPGPPRGAIEPTGPVEPKLPQRSEGRSPS